MQSLKNEISTKIKCLINEIAPASSLKYDIRDRAFKNFGKGGSNKIGGSITNNPSLDLKSENSSIYKNSVAAFSA